MNDVNIIICPRCGMHAIATMDIQQVCQNCGRILRKQKRGELMNKEDVMGVLYAVGIAVVIGLTIWLLVGMA